jgi:hypothetical protein
MEEAIITALEIEWRFNSNNGEVCYFDADGTQTTAWLGSISDQRVVVRSLDSDSKRAAQ